SYVGRDSTQGIPEPTVAAAVDGSPLSPIGGHNSYSHLPSGDRNSGGKRKSITKRFLVSHLRGEPLPVQREHCYGHLNYYPFTCQFNGHSGDWPTACGQRFITFDSCVEHLRGDHFCRVTDDDMYEVVSDYFEFNELRQLDELINNHLNNKAMPSLMPFDDNDRTDGHTGGQSISNYSGEYVGLFGDQKRNEYDVISDGSVCSVDNELSYRFTDDSADKPNGKSKANGYRKRQQNSFTDKYFPNDSNCENRLDSQEYPKKRRGRPPKNVDDSPHNPIVECSQEVDIEVDLTHKRTFANWFTQTKRTKYPYFPQKDDDVYYIPYGHSIYRREVLQRGIYGLANKHYAMKQYPYDHVLAKVTKIDFLFKERRTEQSVVRCVYITLRPYDKKYGTIIHVKYHDMEGVVDFIVLREHYEQAMATEWSVGDEFRSLVDDHYWFGVVIGFNAADYSQVSRFRAIEIKWHSNGATDYLSPWDLEPIPDDPSLLAIDRGSRVAVTDDDRDAFFQSLPDEWPHYDERRELRRVANGLKIILTMEKTREFCILDDLTESRYRDKILYPVDMKTFIARVENRFYRRHLAIKYDLKFMEANIRKLVKSVKRDPEFRFDELIAKRLKYHTKFVTALSLLFIDTHDCKNPYDLYPNIDEYLETHDVKCYSAKRVHLNLVKKHPNLLPAPHKRLARPQSFGDSAKQLRIYRALKNTHSRTPFTYGSVQALSAPSASVSPPLPPDPTHPTPRGSTISYTPHTLNDKPRKPLFLKAKKAAAAQRRKTSTPKKRPKSTLNSAPLMSAFNERTNRAIDDTMKEGATPDRNSSSQENRYNTCNDNCGPDPQMYSSDVSISENEYNFINVSDESSGDDSEVDPDFKTSTYYKYKIKIPHLKEYQNIFKNTGV
ncbi:unnamed protein product, partial [Medioppia subpectinata]